MKTWQPIRNAMRLQIELYISSRCALLLMFPVLSVRSTVACVEGREREWECVCSSSLANLATTNSSRYSFLFTVLPFSFREIGTQMCLAQK